MCRSCVDSVTWHKVGDSSKDCTWVSEFTPKRCDARGFDDSGAKVDAAVACPAACGTCSKPYRIETCLCTFPYHIDYDSGAKTRVFGCHRGFCEYHIDADNDGESDVNGWGYCGAAVDDDEQTPTGDLNIATNLCPTAPTSVRACSGCAALAEAVGGTFGGQCVNTDGSGYYCDNYNTLADPSVVTDNTPYQWMYCDAPDDEFEHDYVDADMVAGYGCDVNVE